MRPTVLIVDDHAEFRASASELLEAEGFDVIGAADDAARAVELALRLRPQVVLLDVQLPDRDGFAVAARLAQEAQPPQVVLISSRDAVAYGRRVADAPVRGFIAKRDLTGAALAALVTLSDDAPGAAGAVASAGGGRRRRRGGRLRIRRCKRLGPGPADGLAAVGRAGWSRGTGGRAAWLARCSSPPVGCGSSETSSAALVYAYRGPLLHCTLTYPGGRARGRCQALTVAGAYLAAVIAQIWRSETLDDRPQPRVRGRRGRASARRRGPRAARADLRAAGHGRRRLPARRGPRSSAWPSARRRRPTLSLRVFEAALALLAIMLVRGLLREPWARTVATDLVVELSETRFGVRCATGSRVRSAIRRSRSASGSGRATATWTPRAAAGAPAAGIAAAHDRRRQTARAGGAGPRPGAARRSGACGGALGGGAARRVERAPAG